MFSSRLAYLSVWYLYMGIILWILGWVTLWIAVPVCLLLVMGLWRLRPESRKSYNENRLVPWWGWAFLITYAATCVFLCGFDGRVMQSWDFIVRNPLYAHLTEQSWPTQLLNGNYVVYPLSFWLTPASFSQLCPSYATQVLQCWVFAGILLTALNIWQILGGKRAIIMLCSMFLFAPLTQVADDILNTIFYIDAFYSTHFRLLSPLTQMFNTYHFYVSGCLALSLLISRTPTSSMIIITTAGLACTHPMMAVMIFPWVIYKYMRTTITEGVAWFAPLFRPITLGAIAAVTLIGIYYASSTGNQCCLVFDAPHAKGYSKEYLWAFSTGVILNILPLLVVWFICRRSILLYLACCVPALMLFWMGQENGISEWWYKFSVAYAFILLLSILSSWDKKSARLCLLLLMVFSLIPCMRILKQKELPKAAAAALAINPDFIASQYSRMDEIDDKLYKQFISDKLKFPFLFKKNTSHQ